MRDSFIFYRSFYEASAILTIEQKVAFFDAIMEYSFNQTETELEPMVNALYLLVKPQLMANQKRYKNGALGGRPKTTGSKANKPNKNVNKNKNVNLNDNKIVKPVIKKAPTFEEVDVYIKESLSDYELDSNKIFHYYNDADWFDAKGNKVLNWKQKIRGNWCKEENKRSSQSQFSLEMDR